MSRQIAIAGAVVAAGLLFLLADALFVVHQTRQALVLQFGNPVRVVREPGLNAKLSLIQQVEYFERRVLDYDAASVELILGDQRRLVVDAFARYRIADPLRFRQSAGTELGFVGRLEPILYSALRSVLGSVSLFQLLSADRSQLMGRIRDEANRQLDRFGVEVVDVRIKRADLPKENSDAIYRRMRAERLREANELRAQGAEVAQRIRARAERERQVLIAEAEQQAEILRGEGDAEALRIFAEAVGQDPEFFAFYRSMRAYRKALADGATSFVLSPKSEFFRFFDRIGVYPEGGAPADRSGLAARPEPGAADAVPAAAPAAVPEDARGTAPKP